MKIWLKIITLSSLFIASSLHAAACFRVEKIEIEGLQSVSRATLLNYLGVKQGQQLCYTNTEELIKRLYAPNFFSDIHLFQQANTLLIKVQERPTISAITVTGSRTVPQDKFTDALKKMGLQKGRFFNPAILHEFKQTLYNLYYSIGQYNVRVDIAQTQQKRNRVAIAIKISEGAVVKVANIKIIGNRRYSEDIILKNLHLHTSNLSTFFSHRNQYSTEKLQQTQQDIEDFYMDRGYINVKVDSTQVTITPDHKHTYVVFKITEGNQYRFSGYHLSGPLLGKATLLSKAVQLRTGDIFSRQKMLDSARAMKAALGNAGYAFANIIPKLQIDNKTKTVLINFIVKPGSRYYIRHINFTGNTKTSELALRNQFFVMEGSLFSVQNIDDSIRRLRQNLYVDATQPPQVKLIKVPGSDDLLDLDVSLVERPSAELQFSIGYAQVEGLLFNTSLMQYDFMGTGKTVGLNINWSSYEKSFNINYTNPYYTPSGVSRDISLYGSKHRHGRDFNNEASLSSYSIDSYGVDVSYGFPTSVYSTLHLGYGLASLHVNDVSSTALMQKFVNNYGAKFKQLFLTAGWSRNTEDVTFFPNQGTEQRVDLTISAPISKHALQYYTLTYTHDWFHPLNQYFTLRMYGVLGYGNGYGFMKTLPFFRSYYAGGLGNQGINRAYYPYSLGPQSDGTVTGGNLLVSGMASLILPNLFHNPNIRTSLFLDGGNVFDTHRHEYRFKTNSLRYSYGAQLQWRTPIGIPLVFSLAAPLNKKTGDHVERFQFIIGTML